MGFRFLTCISSPSKSRYLFTYLSENFLLVIACFVVIFGINTTSDISKLLQVISLA